MKITGYRNPQLTKTEWESLSDEYRLRMVRNKYTFDILWTNERYLNESFYKGSLDNKECRMAVYAEMIERLKACDGIYYTEGIKENDSHGGHAVVNFYFDDISDAQHISAFMSASLDPNNYKETLDCLA